MISESDNPVLLANTRIIAPKCPSCGGTISFDPKSNNLLCHYCGYSEQLTRHNDQIKEIVYQFNQAVEETILLEGQAKKVYHCNSCGANIMVDKDQLKSKCTFCAADAIVEEAFDHRMVKPAVIIPFYL